MELLIYIVIDKDKKLILFNKLDDTRHFRHELTPMIK